MLVSNIHQRFFISRFSKSKTFTVPLFKSRGGEMCGSLAVFQAIPTMWRIGEHSLTPQRAGVFYVYEEHITSYFGGSCYGQVQYQCTSRCPESNLLRIQLESSTVPDQEDYLCRLKQGLISQLYKAATWSSTHTFGKYYQVNVQALGAYFFFLTIYFY